MWKPSVLGEVIAERQLLFKRRGKRPRSVQIEFGRPVRAPRAQALDPWFCPVQIKGMGRQRLMPVAGEDSLQSLVLALRWCETELRRAGRRAGGYVEWGGDDDRPVFAHTVFLELMECSIKNLVAGLRAAVDLLEHPVRGRGQRAALARLYRTIERMGFEHASRAGTPKSHDSG